MCGIIGLYIKKKYDDNERLAKTLFNIYAQQSHRGQEGFGIAISQKDNKDIKRIRTTNDTTIFGVWNKTLFDEMNKEGTYVLFHHRIPTCTTNKPKFNHPIMNEKQDLAIIHNGILYDEEGTIKKLKEKHTWETKGEDDKITDSEMLIHMYEEKRGKTSDALQYVEDNIRGLLAIIGIDKEQNEMFGYKRNNPLVLSENENLLILTSEYHEDYFQSINAKTIKELATNEAVIINRKGEYHIKTLKENKDAGYKCYSSIYEKEDEESFAFYISRLNKKLSDTQEQIEKTSREIMRLNDEIIKLDNKIRKSEKPDSKKNRGRTKRIKELEEKMTLKCREKAELLKLEEKTKKDIKKYDDLRTGTCEVCQAIGNTLEYVKDCDTYMCLACRKEYNVEKEFNEYCCMCNKKIEDGATYYEKDDKAYCEICNAILEKTDSDTRSLFEY